MRNTSALKNQKGSAIQLALIASTIFSLGAYSLITVSETSTKVTNSYVASSLVESLSTTLSSAIHNRRSYFVSSAKQPNKLPKDCLLDYMSTTCIPLAGSTNTPADRGGTFDLYSSSQTLISGEYNANAIKHFFARELNTKSGWVKIGIWERKYRIDIKKDCVAHVNYS